MHSTTSPSRASVSPGSSDGRVRCASFFKEATGSFYGVGHGRPGVEFMSPGPWSVEDPVRAFIITSDQGRLHDLLVRTQLIERHLVRRLIHELDHWRN